MFKKYVIYCYENDPITATLHIGKPFSPNKTKDMIRTFLILIICCLAIDNSFCQLSVGDSQNQFALSIYNNSKPDSSNFLISPISINIALAIITEGSQSETKNELHTLLGLTGIDTFTNYYHSLIVNSQFQNNPDYLDRKRDDFENGIKYGENHLDICNSLWYNSKYKLNSGYLDKINNNYNSEIFSYSDVSGICDQINDWVSNKTNKRISFLPCVIDNNTRLTVINATYLIAEWENAFEKKNTKKRKFKYFNHTSDKIDFMYKHTQIKYYENEDIQVVSLPYQGDMLSMLILLPYRNYGLPNVEKKLDLKYFNDIVSKLNYNDVELYMPKFRIESELSLIKPLEDLGLKHVFTSNADFSLIDSQEQVWIGDIYHKTFIETDEEKTEAAAATEVVVVGYGGGEHEPPPPPKIVDIDHPFLFYIIDNRSNGIFFMGKYMTK
jgi:serpin B